MSKKFDNLQTQYQVEANFNGHWASIAHPTEDFYLARELYLELEHNDRNFRIVEVISMKRVVKTKLINNEDLLKELKSGIIQAVYSENGLDGGDGTYLISEINKLLGLPISDYGVEITDFNPPEGKE